MPEVLKGVVVSYRRGPKTQRPKECLIRFHGVKSVSGAGQLIGRKVAWPSGERKFLGKIVALHAKNGLVKAHFRKGLPGNALDASSILIFDVFFFVECSAAPSYGASCSFSVDLPFPIFFLTYPFS